MYTKCSIVALELRCACFWKLNLSFQDFIYQRIQLQAWILVFPSGQLTEIVKEVNRIPALQGILFSVGQVRMGLPEKGHFKTTVYPYFWKRRIRSEVLESRAIFWSSQAPEYLNILVPCCSLGPDTGKPCWICRQDLHHWCTTAAKLNALGKTKAIGLTKNHCFSSKKVISCLYRRKVTHWHMKLWEHRASSG